MRPIKLWRLPSTRWLAFSSTAAAADDCSNAEDLARQALKILQAISDEETAEVASSFYMLGSALLNQGRLAEAEAAYLRALAMRRGILKEHPDVASSLNNLAMVYRAQGKWDQARAALLEALAMQTNLFGAEHPDIATSLHNLGVVAESQGNLAEAESLKREALAMRKKLLPAEHKDLGASLNDRGRRASGPRQAGRGRSCLSRSAGDAQKVIPPDHPELLASLKRAGGHTKDQGKLAEAEELCRESLTINRKRGKEDRALADSLNGLAQVLQAEKKFSEAVALRREALALERKLSGEKLERVADALLNVASVLGDQGNLAEVKATVREALPLYLKELERGPTNNPAVNRHYGLALYGYAVVCLGTGDTNGYRATAAQIVAQLERRVEGRNVLLSWACALAPDAVTNYAPLLEVVRAVLARQTNTPKSLYDLATLGALFYRAGRYPEAARQLTETYQLGQPGDTNATTTIPAQSAYLLALTHAQLGHTNEASKWFRTRFQSRSFRRGDSRARCCGHSLVEPGDPSIAAQRSRVGPECARLPAAATLSWKGSCPPTTLNMRKRTKLMCRKICLPQG